MGHYDFRSIQVTSRNLYSCYLFILTSNIAFTRLWNHNLGGVGAVAKHCIILFSTQLYLDTISQKLNISISGTATETDGWISLHGCNLCSNEAA